MKPEKVNPKKFKQNKIVYNNGVFSIAYGKWENKDDRLAMRWNGAEKRKNDIGYPKMGKYPLWFILPKEIGDFFLEKLKELE